MLPLLLPVRAATHELKKGETLGRYEIIQKLAVGGMAEIYLGRVRGTAGFDKLVAIKRVLPHMATEQFVEMFLAEARLAATLHHPNIGDVFDVGVVNGSYFFAMEFIHGQDLRSVRLESAALGQKVPLEIALAIVSGIASALHYTHTRTGPNGPLNLVHRDVSPSNILVSYDGAVKLVDFGIARAKSTNTLTRTRTGQLKGKIPYMSPEACRAKQVDGRADLFSLGTVLYELLTNERPFDGKGDFDTLERIVHGTMQPPSEIVPTIPPALEAIVLRMLANKRSARFQSAEDLLHALEQLTTEHGLYVSAFAVGKYMREMFSEDAQRLPDLDDEEPPTLSPDHAASADIAIDIADPAPARAPTSTREYPRGASPGALFGLELSTSDLDPVPTPVSNPPPAPASEFKVVFRPPSEHSRAGLPDATPFPQVGSNPFGPLPFLDEEGSRDQTHADLVPPFDPIASRGSQLLATIDPDLVDDRDLPLGVLNKLLQVAAMSTESGDLENAVIAVELMLSADRGAPGALDLLAKNYAFMTEVFERYLGDTSRIVALMEQSDQIAEMPLDHRALYLLSLLDGSIAASELIQRADMPQVEAYRHLTQLILRRVVMLV